MKKITKRQEPAPAPRKNTAGKSAAPSRKDSDMLAKRDETFSRAAVETVNAVQQAEAFEKAMRLFHSSDYVGARAIFEQAACGPVPAMAHTARLHSKMCDRRLSQAGPKIDTPEDRYNYAVGLINLRRLDDAEDQLNKALEAAPNADHLHYALALTRGLQGDYEGAHRHMKRAIDLQPRNRTLARNDPDFVELLQRGALRELLYS